MSEADDKRQKYVAIGYPVGAAFPTGIPSGLETDPEVSAKRTAEMQQMAAGPPFEGNLTIIWESEKEQLLGRQDYLEKRLADCEARLNTLEKWAIYSASPNPPAFPGSTIRSDD